MPDTLSIEMPRILAAAQKASGLLRVLANENRLLLMCQLSQGEKSVGELETLLGIRQPTLSQQLGILREEGLVTTRRAGKQVIYRVSNDDALQILQTLYRLYCQPAQQPPRS
ncbi:MAG: ArsR/SmtB family transcription factor [Brachymonas sp.]